MSLSPGETAFKGFGLKVVALCFSSLSDPRPVILILQASVSQLSNRLIIPSSRLLGIFDDMMHVNYLLQCPANSRHSIMAPIVGEDHQTQAQEFDCNRLVLHTSTRGRG